MIIVLIDRSNNCEIGRVELPSLPPQGMSIEMEEEDGKTSFWQVENKSPRMFLKRKDAGFCIDIEGEGNLSVAHAYVFVVKCSK